jgi:hypothetical protein
MKCFHPDRKQSPIYSSSVVAKQRITIMFHPSRSTNFLRQSADGPQIPIKIKRTPTPASKSGSKCVKLSDKKYVTPWWRPSHPRQDVSRSKGFMMRAYKNFFFALFDHESVMQMRVPFIFRRFFSGGFQSKPLTLDFSQLFVS